MGWRASAARLAASAALAGAVAGPARALPQGVAEALAPPADAEILRDAPAEPATTSVPLRTAGAEAPVAARFSGAVSRRALRMPGGPATLALIDAAEAALAALGFETALRCDTADCGGFAFRDAIEVLPQPEMAVNLADFRQLTMRRSEAEGGETLVALLVSRFDDTTLAQITAVEGARRARTVSAPPVAEPPPLTRIEAEAPPAMAPGDADAGTAAPAAGAPAAGAPGNAEALLAELRERGSVALDGIAFEPGSTALARDSAGTVARAAEALRLAPELSVLVVGHTDASGSLAINRRVSRDRAESVRRALVAEGIAPGRLEAEGAGYLAPRAPHATETGRALNRRVELVALP